MSRLFDGPGPKGLVVPTSMALELQARYSLPPRAYHHLGHIEEMVGWLNTVEETHPWEHPREVYLAALFHDAFYVAGADDNEARSAELADSVIARDLPGASIDVGRVRDLIELTARHGRVARDEVDPEAARFLDCDMAILGAPPERYDSYERGIALEYAALPADVFFAGRRAFLQRLLEGERLFLSDFFHGRLDAAARRNLNRVLGGQRT